MNNQSTPDPQQFARVVLWHLCGIQATLQLMEAREIKDRGQKLGASVSDILTETAANGAQIQKPSELLYRDALELANIKPSPIFPKMSGQ